MELIGYSSPYIPVELISAAGYEPYHLLHGDIELAKESEPLLGPGACLLVRSNAGFVLKNRDRFAALVGATGCDTARRLHAALGEASSIPYHIFNNPRTDNRTMYYNEIDHLIVFLNRISGMKFSKGLVRTEIDKWENARDRLRSLNAKRQGHPSLVSTVTFHKAAADFHRGNIEKITTDVEEESSYKPRVYLLGSPLPYEASEMLALIENRLRIVGDLNCGSSRFLNIDIKAKTVEGIKDAYYGQPDCIFKRPNKRFYTYVETQTKELKCTAIIVWVLDHCDIFDFEIVRMEENFSVPILKLKGDLSQQARDQVKTRIEAFIEMLSNSRSSIL